jgi:hypothetical protein
MLARMGVSSWSILSLFSLSISRLAGTVSPWISWNQKMKECHERVCMGLLSRWLHPASSSRGDGDDVNKQFVQLKDILPIDLRPYGVVIRKYEYYPIA